MMPHVPTNPRIAIACGGTGGHLFPGIAVAHELRAAGCDVTLLISPKEVDQKAVQNLQDFELLTLPAVGLTRWGALAFARGFLASFRVAGKHFKQRVPKAVLAMGGFTSAPPVLAGKMLGSAAFLHESNAFPGRANRYLARVVDTAFVGFADAAKHLGECQTRVTGTPVRSEFKPRDSGPLREALGLDPARPVLLVLGGSQGALGLNRCVLEALSLLVQTIPELQFVHLAGSQDLENVRSVYRSQGLPAIVEAFSDRMPLLMGAATVAISRSGASSLAELAAVRLPAVFIPFPQATDNHQVLNAEIYVRSGAALMMAQASANPEKLSSAVARLVREPELSKSMQAALTQWHAAESAGRIANEVLSAVSAVAPQTSAPLQTRRQAVGLNS